MHAILRTDDAHLRRIGVNIWLGDLAGIDSSNAALAGINYVIHCAADARFGNGSHYRTANVELTRQLLDAVKPHDVRRFVFVSTIGAVDRPAGDRCTAPLSEESTPHPTSDYGRSKLEAEQIVRKSGIPFSIVRPAMVVGPEMRMNSHMAVFLRWALARALPARIAWTGRFSIVAVDDLAKALLLCAQHPQAADETFFCAGEAMAVQDCFALACPGTWRVPMGWANGLAAPLARFVPFGLKGMLLDALTASDAKLRRLGWTPEHSARSILQTVIHREQARLDPEIDPGGQAVVTGAASGLGRAVAEQLVTRRRHLLLIDRDQAGLESFAIAHPNCRCLPADLSNEADLERIVNSPAWLEHPVTELYAIAGMGKRGAAMVLPLKDQLDTVKVNVLARLFLSHVVLQSMTRRHFGRVLIIGSSSAFQPLPYMAVYAASNAALLSLSEAWAAELDESGVHLMIACPGGMQTAFQRQGKVRVISNEKLMDPRTVALAIFRGFARHQTTLLIPFRSLAMSLLARVAPRRFVVFTWKHLMKRYR